MESQTEEFRLNIDAPHGLSQVEIADIFCVSRQTVQNIEAIAIRKLRMVMECDSEFRSLIAEVIGEGLV